MKQLIILGVISLIVLVSCTLAKKPRYYNQNSKKINITGTTTAGEYKIEFPCNIKIQANNKIIVDTNSNDSGFYEFSFNVENNTVSVLAIVTPIKESIIKDTIVGAYQTITIGCKDKYTNSFYSDTFSVDISTRNHNFNINSCTYFLCCDVYESH